MTTTTNTNIFNRYELDAFLGDFIEDYDVDAIIDEATEIDYTTGNRFWKDDIDLAEICARHDVITAVEAEPVKAAKSLKGIKATCSETKRIGTYMGDHVDAYYDREANEVYGIYLISGEFTEPHNDNYLHFATYYQPVTMSEIKSDLAKAL